MILTTSNMADDVSGARAPVSVALRRKQTLPNSLPRSNWLDLRCGNTRGLKGYDESAVSRRTLSRVESAGVSTAATPRGGTVIGSIPTPCSGP